MSKANAAKQAQSRADELKSLADNFLASQCVAKSEEVQEASPLLIGVPCFGGSVQYRTVNLLMSLSSLLTQRQIPHQTHFVASESLVTRARNHLASVAAFTRDSAGRPFGSLLFLDADVAFDPQYVLRMLEARLPIVGLTYSRKSLDFSQIAEAAKRGIPPEQLSSFGGWPIFNAEKEFVLTDKPVAVRNAGTGAMLISVEVLKALSAAFPERKYKSAGLYQPHLERVHDFFRPGIHDEEFYSEDYEFCEDARGLGFQTYILPARTEHVGSFPYVMDMHAVGALRARIGAEFNAELSANAALAAKGNKND